MTRCYRCNGFRTIWAGNDVGAIRCPKCDGTGEGETMWTANDDSGWTYTGGSMGGSVKAWPVDSNPPAPFQWRVYGESGWTDDLAYAFAMVESRA